MTDRWTADLVAERMASAASTLARSRTLGVGPSGMRGFWPTAPATAEDQRLAYGYNAAVAPRILPSAAELSALDQVLNWTSRYLSGEACKRVGLPSDAGWVAWERAKGLSLPKISETRQRRWAAKPPGGNSREAVRVIAERACDLVARSLDRDGVPLHVGSVDAPPEPPPVATGRREAMPRTMDTRRWVMNREPCGTCAGLRRHKDGTTTCGPRGGGVAPSLRAQHPEGEPCWQEKADG